MTTQQTSSAYKFSKEDYKPKAADEINLKAGGIKSFEAEECN